MLYVLCYCEFVSVCKNFISIVIKVYMHVMFDVNIFYPMDINYARLEEREREKEREKENNIV